MMDILHIFGYLIIWGMISYKRHEPLTWKEVLIMAAIMALAGALISAES